MGDTLVEIAGINVTEFRAEGLRLLRKGGAQSCKLVRQRHGGQQTQQTGESRDGSPTKGTARAFRQKFTLDGAIGSHACALQLLA